MLIIMLSHNSPIGIKMKHFTV